MNPSDNSRCIQGAFWGLTLVTFTLCCRLCLNSVKKLLTDGLNKNQYLKRLELQQIKDMVECMYERTYLQGEYVVKQGEPGNHLFVLAGRSTRGQIFSSSPDAGKK